jgi:uncharacterized protein YndB with AHSA1/START domain
MKDLHFGIDIAAPVARVWDCMLDPIAYRDWTRAFCEGSYFDGDWAEGSRMRFLDPDGNSMEAVVDEHRRHARIVLRLVGELREGRPSGSDRPPGASAQEIYEFGTAPGGGTRLDIRLRGWDDALADMMAGMWPQALQRLKTLAESTH